MAMVFQGSRLTDFTAGEKQGQPALVPLNVSPVAARELMH